ncbi:MAG: GreA/GreB family elongation factor [Candidatus Nealsonbacteria bacterium]|nr:GreA/GreB family elongation factor [Candidatus Nealsonbacteria bacterium]
MAEERVFYLTKKGLEKTKKEYNSLKEFKLAKTKGELPELLHSEDINPEYLAFQEDLNFLESRLMDIENTLKNVELIKIPSKSKQDIINLGATVVIEADKQLDEFTILGTLEANPSLGIISNESIVGKALLGHKVGDVVTVQSVVKTTYKIKKIEYKRV